MPKGAKVCDKLEHLPTSENKGVSIETRADISVTHLGVALGRPDFGSEEFNSTCVLQTAKVRVYGNNDHCVTTTVFFHTGSDRSYVSSSL